MSAWYPSSPALSAFSNSRYALHIRSTAPLSTPSVTARPPRVAAAERVQDRGGPLGQHRADRRRGAPAGRPRAAPRSASAAAACSAAGHCAGAGPGRGLGHVEQRAQVAVGVGAEHGRLRGQLGRSARARASRPCSRSRLRADQACRAPRGASRQRHVSSARAARSRSRVRISRRGSARTRPRSPALQDANFSALASVRGLVFGEEFGGFVVLGAQPVDAGAPPGQVIVEVAASPRARTRSSAARSNSATARSTLPTSSGPTGMSRSAPAPAQPPVPRVEFRDRRVEDRLCFAQAGPRAADSRAAASLTSVSASATGAVRGNSRRARGNPRARLRPASVPPRPHLAGVPWRRSRGRVRPGGRGAGWPGWSRR